MNNSPFSFSQALIKWQLVHGRHDLPWQNTTDAYRIWLSEIMLQQTQVVTVKDYYARFLKRFPDVQSLASAEQDEVLALWTGLGYYSRARNLHACARSVVADFGGEFPRTPEQLVTLKGIGASTAAAIAVFAYGYPAAILDGNVKRIIARVMGVRAPASAATDKILWQHANELLVTKADAKKLKMPHATALRIYTQGLMDLGASLCARGTPQCTACPMQTNCYARIHQLTDDIPAAKARKVSPEFKVALYVYQHAGRLWLEKRADQGIWAGLYSFPEQNRLNFADLNESEAKLQHIRHVLTHRVLYLQPHLFQLDASQARALEDTENAGQGGWFSVEDLKQVGLPKPILELTRRILE
ncbi:A/G-specific adenine glycosylase [Hydromonas duriensis]|uniref:Adenine DNA glycosylase n=1 Tax=Hydromonas duriensis TaxID=1527608 RepID=A0A4R6Y9A2_9BURK|nr:A/G-specific adenine glycosylase [Hydromonas duriensis]TDR32034.1 A/G-specific DNA-adenine glycosylase [Hydromonas duriensis]